MFYIPKLNRLSNISIYNSIKTLSSTTSLLLSPTLTFSSSFNSNNNIIKFSSSSSSINNNMTSTPPPQKQLTIKEGLEELVKRKFFYTQSYQIYQGVAGLYDYGPPGCAVKANLINFWRQHFIINEDMLEVDCTALTPEVVLKTSGHVAKFADFMVKDTVTKQCYRADHLLEGHVEKLMANEKNAEKIAEYKHVLAKCGDYGQQQLTEALHKYKCKSPDTGNDITEPYPFNLMFATQIGPSGQSPGFLRPETAQGIFVNFKTLLEYNGGRLPFAAAQIGNSYRNEIAPRAGLLRVREFTMAEIEHFVNPRDKSHPKFKEIANVSANLLTSAAQDGDKAVVNMTFGDAVAKGVINNETLAYFMCRTQIFLHAVGIKPNKLRFRQHQANEMAHYASDCWDAEIQYADAVVGSGSGWVECVGHADRSCYDLTVHSEASKVPLVAFEPYADGPRQIEYINVKLEKGVLGKTFKKDKNPSDYLESLTNKLEEALKLKDELEKDGSATIVVNGQGYNITKDMVTLTKATKTAHGETYSPHVIEPSFGLGRVIYFILEHNFYNRNGDQKRCVLSLPPIIAPLKCSLLPLTGSEKLAPFVQTISRQLKDGGISNKVDDTGVSIGRRYARTDEIGVPFGITIDFQTPEDRTVTLRERDTTKQVRIPIDDLVSTLKQLCENQIQWSTVLEKYPIYESKEQDN